MKKSTTGKWRDKNGTAVDQLPAIPPDDYEGSFAKWHTELIRMGLMKDDDELCDIMISRRVYNNLLKKCEAE